MDDSRAMPYEVRCPLHGSIAFSRREAGIINHPFYQRLRAVSQLGFSSLVYPGATHTRFSHGLGVMELAGRIFDHIVAAPGAPLRSAYSAAALGQCRQLVRLAALLHDVGHPPFSHSFEPLLPLRGALPLPVSWYRDPQPERQASHEDFSVAVIHALAADAPALLSLEEARDVCALLHEGIAPTERLAGQGAAEGMAIFPLLKQIISGEIDADRMDYLRRDAYFAGVAYGYFDLDRLVQALSCVPTEAGLVMALDRNALYTYENFLMTRFHMAMQVYLHKTVLLFEHYLHRAVEAGEVECRLDGKLENFLAAREDTLMAKLHAARRQPWSRRIVERVPSPRLLQFRVGDGQQQATAAAAALRKAGIEPIHLRAQRRLSTLGVGGEPQSFPLQVYEERLGRVTWRPLEEESVLLDRYNQVFTIENLYCDPRDFDRAVEVLREAGI